MTAQTQQENYQDGRAGDAPGAYFGAPYLLSRELEACDLDPVSAFDALDMAEGLRDGASILESSLMGREGRFSFIHLTPRLEITVSGRSVSIADEQGTQAVDGDPLDILRAEQAKGAATYDDPLAAFTGAMIGYVGYDAVRLFEEIPDRHASIDDSDAPEVLFRRYESAIGFDHQEGRILVSTLVQGWQDNAEAEAAARLDKIMTCLTRAETAASPNHGSVTAPIDNTHVNCDISDEDFYPLVDAARDYIRRGDIFQVVLSRRFEVPFEGDPFELYRAVKAVAPAPYMFYMDLGSRAIVGASPEKLVSLSDGALESCPLAGTRRRGRTEAEDKALAEELLADEKERAEHMMLVDLARNDLGAIAVPGSVRVADLMSVEPYSHVMHLSSSVEGQLKEGCDAFDAIRYALPAGTLSGAPKIRAMEIIDELESSRRGVYGGAICAIDHAGNLNSCIVIRTAVIENGLANIRTGAGIVYESDPRLEAKETHNKARSILSAISHAAAFSLPDDGEGGRHDPAD